MKKIKSSMIAALAMSSFLFASGDIVPVQHVAESTPGKSIWYAGAGYSLMTIGEDAYLEEEGEVVRYSSGEYDQDAIALIAGYNFNKYIGIEGRYRIGIGDATWEDDVDQDLNYKNLAIYVKPMLPVDDFILYGLIGYGKTTYKWPLSEYGTCYELKASGIQYGVGISYYLSENLSIFTDYTMLSDGSDQLGLEMSSGAAYATDLNNKILTFGITYLF
jgi:opacity protein-like surface antigen